MYEVWLIRKHNGDDSYSYYSHCVGGFPEWVSGHNSREMAKHFKTQEQAEKVLREISVYLLGKKTDIISAKVRSL
ncbi:MAG: hypothetical protein IJK26_09990 [Clostridia bacterium]|nr:hypothetical protein [Clostridia bacterium]